MHKRKQQNLAFSLGRSNRLNLYTAVQSGIATSVAIAMFQGMAQQRTQAIAVPLIYGLLEATCIPVYCIAAWKLGWTKAPPGEALWTVVARSYESCHDDTNHPHAGMLEESSAAAPLDTVKWMTTESTISYSPVCVQNVDICSNDAESVPKEDADLEGCQTVLAKKFAFHREDTLETASEGSVV